MGWKASRPLYSVLKSEKGIKLPIWKTLWNGISKNIRYKNY